MTITLDYVDRGLNKYEIGQFFNHRRKISQSSHPTVDMLNFIIFQRYGLLNIYIFVITNQPRNIGDKKQKYFV